ncbi:MAG: YcaO-like family protein [Thermodesulfobacteriota bacterium]
MQKNAIRFNDCFKTFTTDQDKAIRPEDTVARFEEKIAGLDLDILEEVKRIDNGRLGIPVYFSVCGADAREMTGTKKQMGKGASADQAKASACMELAERFSFFTFKSNEENFIRGDYKEMVRQGYPVMDMKLLLKSVHDETRDVVFLEKLLEGVPMQWTWATSLGSGEEVLIPFSWFFAINEFNGPSAGNTLEEAAMQGISEIVERHVCSLVNQKKLKTPKIEIDSVRDPVALELIEKFRKNGVELFLNDFTLDTGICTVAAMGMDPSTFPEKSEIVYTAGTTPNPEKALIRAITEVAQLGGDFNSGSNYVASGLPKPLSMEEVSYLTQSDSSIRIEEMADLTHDNIRVEVENCVDALQERDFEVFMIDVTHQQLQIPAIYTIVPGAHFRERSMICDVGLFGAKLITELIQSPAELEAKFRQVAELIPDGYYIHFYRGRNLLEVGDYEDALLHFDRALAHNPEDEDLPYIYSYKGICLKDMERYDDAVEALELGRQVDEERPDLHNTLGVCYFKKEDFHKAIVHFHRAVELNPASAMDYANLGVNYRKIDDRENAIHFFTLALSLDPGIEFAQNQLAELVVEEQN